MPARPKDKAGAAGSSRSSVATRGGRDSVSLVVALTLVGLGAGGILALFSGPLSALVAR
jgi:hypothetical protein